ncbi:TPR-like protein [Glarea lozoyensis ATCC 20868]|uniref:TPR-like protein n=1 Tax=Glarea lozoyensis (strain ATCC 20868 / MF5171) TaxID=1116229 RepID=S3DPI9_GLAL2|nr:TPR-like protein [Glarea lozoyensis ATCC 20868]EPE28358.1 TPR-like protein [Glarea lozoyensis ATCC 20868]
MASRSEKFARKFPEKKDEDPQKSEGTKNDEEEIIKFSPEEEAALIEESNTQKASANALFAKSEYREAIDSYDQALATCPNYLDYEIAVLKSNVSACHLKLEDWKEAVKSATEALDGLERLEKQNAEKVEKLSKEEEEEIEVVMSDATRERLSKIPVEKPEPEQKRLADIERIKAKALMRRAKARSEQGGWSVLQGAEEDYKILATMPNLSAADKRIVQQQLKALPPRTKAAQEKETGEMMDKLKQLGNGILKPFGLSTNNFQMVKDEKTGGYSMNFNQGA